MTQPQPSARIYDFAAHRMTRIAQRRRVTGANRKFLWSWPNTGQFLAVDFPWSPAALSSQAASSRTTRA
jgi:hypothetical protein